MESCASTCACPRSLLVESWFHLDLHLQGSSRCKSLACQLWMIEVGTPNRGMHPMFQGLFSAQSPLGSMRLSVRAPGRSFHWVAINDIVQ